MIIADRIFKGNTDIYDEQTKKVRDDAFNGIFANAVDCANVLDIATTNNQTANNKKKVTISTTGKVEISA